MEVANIIMMMMMIIVMMLIMMMNYWIVTRSLGELYNNLKTHSQAVLTFQTGAISFPLPRPTLPGTLMIMMTAMMTIFLY